MTTVSESIVKKLIPRETIVAATRESLMVHYPQLTLAFLSFVFCFFWWSALVAWGLFGQILFLVWFLVNCIFAWRFLREYLGTITILTLKRLVLINCRHWFIRSIRDIPLTEILDIEAERHGVRQTVASYGTIHVVVGNTPIPIKSVPRPEKFAEYIRKMRAEAIRAEKREERGYVAGEEAPKKLSKQDLEKVLARLARSADPADFQEAAESVLSVSDEETESEL